MRKGGMTLVDAEGAAKLYDAMGPAREISGGSAANTVAGLAALGGAAAFVGQVADDELGEIFGHDIRSAGVHFATAARPGEPPTARCLIFVTPDGQRTMNTYLGATQFLPAAALDLEAIAAAKVLYLEGYLWDPEEPRAAMRRAIDAARAAGREVAFTLSDAFVISRHGDDFRALLADGLIDILFANEAELAAMTGNDDFEAGLAQLSAQVPVLVVTRSEKGAVALARGERAEVAAEPIAARGRHHRRRRPVRRRVPVRPRPRRSARALPAARRGLRCRSHFALRRPARGRLASAGCGSHRLNGPISGLS